MTPIVRVWRIFSGPRRSNFPKSFEFGTIESPDPFAWIITRRMTHTARTERRIVIKMLVKSRIYYEIFLFLQIFGFFHNIWYASSIYFSCMFRIFTLIFSIFIATTFQAYAVCSENNDLTQSSFTICTENINPLPGVGNGSNAK